jgi:hypothetical protein
MTDGARSRLAMPMGISVNAETPVVAQYRTFLVLLVVRVVVLVATMSSPDRSLRQKTGQNGCQTKELAK